MPTEEMEMQKSIFCKNLRELLAASGKSQADLANHMHVSASTVSDWIHGNKMPRMDKIQSIANWLVVNKSDLLEKKEQAVVDPERLLIESYLLDPKIRELVLFAGGIEPGENRDKYIDAIISAYKALMSAQK